MWGYIVAPSVAWQQGNTAGASAPARELLCPPRAAFAGISKFCVEQRPWYRQKTVLFWQPAPSLSVPLPQEGGGGLMMMRRYR